MFRLSTLSAVLGSAFATIVLAQIGTTSQSGPYTITPYSDGACQTAITEYTFNDGQTGNWTIDQSWPAANGWEDVTFKNASTAGQGGYGVWWNIPPPATTCQTVLMKAYTEQSYGSQGPAPYGDIILSSKNGGCIYSSIPAKAWIFGSQCCGDDCKHYSMQGSQPAAPSKRSTIPSPIPEPLTKRSGKSVTARVAEALLLGQRSTSTFDGSSCGVTIVSGPRDEAGFQTEVSDDNACSGSPCSFQKSNGVTTGTTLTSTKDQTITNSFDASLSVSAEVNFLVEKSSVTATVGYGLAVATSKSTSTAVMNSTTETVSMTSGQLIDTKAFMTFTPSYKCWEVEYDCGKGVSDPVNYCQPYVNNDGSPKGTANIVYIDN